MDRRIERLRSRGDRQWRRRESITSQPESSTVDRRIERLRSRGDRQWRRRESITRNKLKKKKEQKRKVGG